MNESKPWYYGAARERDCRRSEREQCRQRELADAARDLVKARHNCGSSEKDETDSVSSATKSQWLYGVKRQCDVRASEKTKRRQQEAWAAVRYYAEQEERRRESRAADKERRKARKETS